jgi:hypothetical protein
MTRKIRVKTTNPMTRCSTGPHLPDPPSLGRPIENPPTDETGRPLNFATGSDVDRLIGFDRRGYPVPKGSPKDITRGTRVRHEDDPPDPYGPEGDLVEPEPSEGDVIRERYGLDDNGFPLPANRITEQQREARRQRYPLGGVS